MRGKGFFSVYPWQPFPATLVVSLTHRQTTDNFLFSRIEPWILNVSSNFPGHPVMPLTVYGLSCFLIVSIVELDHYIAYCQSRLSEFPRSHIMHIRLVQMLAHMRFLRYDESRQKEDVDGSILYYTKAILLSPLSPTQLPFYNAARLLFRLTWALFDRSWKYDRPEDIKDCIGYLRHLRTLPLKSFDISREDVAALLIKVLGTPVRGGVIGNIEEIMVLFREHITPSIPIAIADSIYWVLSKRSLSIPSLNKVIECLRDVARVCQPASDSRFVVLYLMAYALYTRFEQSQSKGDQKNAEMLLDMILDPNQPGKCPDWVRGRAVETATSLSLTASGTFNNPEYFEATIPRLRAYLDSSSTNEEIRALVINALASAAAVRFRHYSLADSREEANFYISQVIDHQYYPSQDEPKGLDPVQETLAIQQNIQRLEDQLSKTPPGTTHSHLLWQLVMSYFVKISHTNDLSDIEQSIKYARLFLNTSNKKQGLDFLSRSLFDAFVHTNNIKYLDEAITLIYDMLKLDHNQSTDFRMAERLVASLLSRWELLHRSKDLDESLRLMELAVNVQNASVSDRFKLSCQWARLARSIGHSSTLAAYKNAMTLIQKSLSFSPTVSIQHTRLVAMGKYCQVMPLNYASFLIGLGRFEEAVETLEQGRAQLWSEMRGLHTPMSQLVGEDQALANQFAEINEELEALTTSITPSTRPEMEVSIDGSKDWTDPFGRLMIKQQRLVEERNTLISQIRERPGLEGFMETPSFTTLRTAASRGPVILINHCEWRSEILIVFHKSLPCSLPTASDFYDRANKLRDELVDARTHGLDSYKYQLALSVILKGLYDLVGKPVVKRLRMLGVPEQSRIWWCPTSVFCSLPLHAMGPIPSSDPSKRYFSDFYITSYTPSLTALIESRNAGLQPLDKSDKPSLLLVAQPEDSLPGVSGEIKVVRALREQVAVVGLVSDAATPTSVVEGLRSSQFAHFACHGVLETGKPFDTSFKLHVGSHLTLLDILKSRLPVAEFAFLSCCHTAENTPDSVADEALHLTAAMQYCGFRSVVGTMWEMADTDGRDLAKNFYKSLFSGQVSGVPYYERTARALRDATQKLRGKRGVSLERWVNFVHYGA